MEKTREYITISLKEHVNGYSLFGMNGTDIIFNEISENKDDVIKSLIRWAHLQEKCV